jgi:hypothetical protein
VVFAGSEGEGGLIADELTGALEITSDRGRFMHGLAADRAGRDQPFRRQKGALSWRSTSPE